jgi:hypothetical protein
VVVVAVGILALLTRGNNAGTRTEAGRRAAGGAPARVAEQQPAAVPNDSAALAAGAAPASSAAAGGEVAPSPSAPSAAASAAAPLAAERSLPTLTVANPADSLRAAMYAVQIVAANTLEGANTKKRDVAWGLPVAVVSPMALAADNTRWFRLTVGAFMTRNDATAYTVDLRRRRKLDVDASNVVAVPYALLLADRVPRASAPARVAAFAARGLPAYALLQADGTTKVYAGAFETPAQASLMASALSVADITPVVVFRTGRAL